MFNYFLVFCVVVTLVSSNQSRAALLAKIITFELIVNLLIKTILKDLDLFTIENMPFIMIVRNMTIFAASLLIFKHRKNIIWTIIVLLYVIAFIYNGLAFDHLFRTGFDSVFEAEYILVMRLVMSSMMICLFVNSFGGGIKNYLDNRLYFVTGRSNNVISSGESLFERINRIWSKS